MNADVTDVAVQNLIVRSTRGDSAAFGELVRQFQPLAFGLAFRLLCDEADAKDVVQESFIRAWTNLGRYDPGKRFSTWLSSIVSNLCMDYLRRRRRWGRWVVRMLPGEETRELPGLQFFDEQYSNEELARTIRHLAGRLSPTQRLVFTLRDLQDLPVSEVVGITGMSERAIKANLWHARKAIRARLLRQGTH